MIRLLIAGTIAYVAYRVTKQLIDDVPGNVDPLLVPSQANREALRRPSAAMGVDPLR